MTFAEALTAVAGSVAVTTAAPTAVPLSSPFDPEVFETTVIPELDAQLTDEVTSAVEPSE